MIIQTPQSSIYSAAILMGKLECTKNKLGKLDCTNSPLRMGVVMKAAYDLVADKNNIWQMVAVTHSTRSALVMEDCGVSQFTETVGDKTSRYTISAQNYQLCEKDPHAQLLVVDGRRYSLQKINDTQGLSIDFDLTYEADTALAKARADIVVLGFVSSSGEGKVVVNDKDWLTRTQPPSADLDADMKRNLFGFEPRAGVPRKDEINNLRVFSSIHRRRPGFFNDAGTGSQLPSGGVVKIYQRKDTAVGTPDCTLQLPNLEQGIRLRTYCGHGPDEGPYWRKVNLGLMRADTLIVEPSKRQAVILWRCHWNADLEPMDRYRKVQIREGGF